MYPDHSVRHAGPSVQRGVHRPQKPAFRAPGVGFRGGSQAERQSLGHNRYARLLGMCFAPVHHGRRVGSAQKA